MITKFITTRIESIARSAARRPRYAPAHPQQFRPRLTTTRGGHIAAVCFRLRSPLDLYFATHRRSNACDIAAGEQGDQRYCDRETLSHTQRGHSPRNPQPSLSQYSRACSLVIALPCKLERIVRWTDVRDGSKAPPPSIDGRPSTSAMPR